MRKGTKEKLSSSSELTCPVCLPQLSRSEALELPLWLLDLPEVREEAVVAKSFYWVQTVDLLFQIVALTIRK